MKATWTQLLFGLGTLLLTFAPQCHADPVELAVTGGNLNGEFAIYAGSSNSESFTLNQDTQLGGVSVLVYPYLHSYPLGTYEITVTAPHGETYAVGGSPLVPTEALPDFLPEGTYLLTVIGGPCNGCLNNVVAGMDYYLPATYTQIGATIHDSGSFYFRLTGEGTAPEPGTWALLATAVLFISARRYWRRSA